MPGNVIRGFDEAEYGALVQAFPPRVIHTEAQLEAAAQQIDRLLALSERTPAQDAYLDLLSTLVQEWETNQVEIPSVSAVEVVKFLCEMHGVTQRALVPIFGTPSIVSEVLAGKRDLQRKHIAGLASYFGVSPAAFFPADPPARESRSEPRVVPPSGRRVASAVR